MNRILVVGAGGALGCEIVRILRATGADVTATYRTPRQGISEKLNSLGAAAAQLDLADTAQSERLLKNADAVVFTPILSVAVAAANLMRDDQRAVFFSSNNVAIDPSAEVYTRLLKAEADLLAAAPQAIILRPTMIYGYPGDGNLSRLMKLMRRLPATPLPGAGKALQQPVYYKALARTAVAALLGKAGHPQLCAVAGPEPISQRALFLEVARAGRARTLIVPLPVMAFAPVFKLIEQLGLKLPISSAQLARTGLDKTPQAQHVILTETSLAAGLEALVRDIDASHNTGSLDDAAAGA